MSKRETAITEMVTRLGQILVKNGYATDAGAALRVMEHISEGPGEPDAFIHLVVLDDVVDPQQLEHVIIELTFDVNVVAKATTPWQTIESIIADVKKAVEQPDRTLNGALLTRGLRRGTTRARPREDGSAYVGAVVEYVGSMAEVWGAP